MKGPLGRGERTDPRQRRSLQASTPWTFVYAAGTPGTIDCQHHLGSRNVFVVVFLEDPPGSELNPAVEHTDANTTRLIFGGALPFKTRVVISGL